MKKRILIISQNFYPEIGSAGNRMKNIYELLIQNGKQVCVLTTEPTYPNRNIYEDDKFWNEEKLNNEDNIKRIKVKNKKYSMNLFNRLLYYLEVALKMLLFILRDKNKFDVILVTTPPIFVAIAGLIAKYRFRAKLVLDVRDLWPDSLNGVGVLNHPLIIYFFSLIETFLYKKADEIIVNSRGFIKSIENKANVEKDKISFIPNGAKEEELQLKKQPNGQFNVIYAGNIGLAQDYQLLLDLAKKLESYAINLVVIGYGINRINFEKKIKETNLKNVSFIKPQTRKECLSIIKQHAVGIVTLTNKDVFETVLPGKVIDYMTCGVPIVASVSGNSKQIIEDGNVGFASKDRNAEEMVNYILYLLNHSKKRDELSSNGIKFVSKHFLWEKNIQKLLKIIDNKKEKTELQKEKNTINKVKIL